MSPAVVLFTFSAILALVTVLTALLPAQTPPRGVLIAALLLAFFLAAAGLSVQQGAAECVGTAIVH